VLGTPSCLSLEYVWRVGYRGK